MTSNFAQSQAQLDSIEMQQSDLRRAVDAGELWMDAEVAETAARRCEQAAQEIDDWLRRARELTRKRKFGDNKDGNEAAERFAEAGREVVTTMRNAQDVFTSMAATFRAAGRTVTEADEAGREAFWSKPE